MHGSRTIQMSFAQVKVPCRRRSKALAAEACPGVVPDQGTSRYAADEDICADYVRGTIMPAFFGGAFWGKRHTLDADMRPLLAETVLSLARKVPAFASRHACLKGPICGLA